MARTKTIAALAGLLAFAATAQANAATYTFTPAADSQVMSDAPTTASGSATRLTADSYPTAQMLMRFQVANILGTVTSARVRVFVNNPSPDGPALYRSTAPWSEATVTWNTRPAISGSGIANVGAVYSGTWVEYSVTPVVKANGTYDFVLSGGSTDSSTYHSRETTEKPQLVIVTSSTTTTPTEPTPTPTPTPTPSPSPSPTPSPTPTPTPTTGSTVDVTLQPASGISGTQRVNFALPLPKGRLLDPDQIRVMSGTTELRAARRELAVYADGSIRSVQIQIDTAVSAGKILTLRVGENPTTAALSMVAVTNTLVTADGTQGPKVWARLPATWLAASGVTGPQVTEASVEGTNLDAFDRVCNYTSNDVTKFISLQTSKDVWLYDRGTAMYRGYARRGDQSTLASAYRETAIYRSKITGTDAATRIGVPGAAGDLKYHYNQNLAIHYLLTGDDRFRESAEDIATRVQALWGSPGYAGGSDFWTERHAGFGLLAYVWARIVTDDQGAALETVSAGAVNAYISMQSMFATSYTDSTQRCFAHTPASAGESFAGQWGCSPWMSAIIADAMDQFATETGGGLATTARSAIVKLGKVIATQGRDSTGKPYYWMGVGSLADDRDPYHEHWGEPAYVVAMAYFHGGKTDATLKTAATQMLAGLKSYGSVPHLRSFNWQCRSAIAAPYYLK